MTPRFLKRLNNSSVFILTLLVVSLLYLFINWQAGVGFLSSDVWGYQFLEMQSRFQYWDYIPPSYNQSEIYLAFPLLYYLSPGLEYGVVGYHILALIVIVATFVVSGLVIKKFFDDWFFAAIAGLLMIIPRFVFPTRMGLLDLGVVRGSILVMPFYALLGYWWTIRGVFDKKWNIISAILAGISIYLYPPFGVLAVATFFLAAFTVHRFKIFKQLVIFSFVYFLVASPFVINHIFNPNTSMIDNDRILTTEEISLQTEIIKDKFAGSGFLETIPLSDIKRSLWDESILVLILILSLGLIFYFKKEKDDNDINLFISITLVTLVVTVSTIAFSLIVDFINTWFINKGSLPFFVDHLRPLKTVGISLIIQSVAFCFLVYRKFKWGEIIIIIVIIVLVILPIRFSAPIVRMVVRVIVPIEIREKYNLAPVVPPEDVRSFVSVADVAYWARENVDSNESKIFVFDDAQNDFRFKVLSRQETNLTRKEGNLWVTSNFENSKIWYNERQKYQEIVGEADDFGDIIVWAKELGCTHMLVPRGEYWDLLSNYNKTPNVLYKNNDYKLITIE